MCVTVELVDLGEAVAAEPHLELTGLWTHFATADEEDDSFLREQLARFQAVATAASDACSSSPIGTSSGVIANRSTLLVKVEACSSRSFPRSPATTPLAP